MLNHQQIRDRFSVYDINSEKYLTEKDLDVFSASDIVAEFNSPTAARAAIYRMIKLLSQNNERIEEYIISVTSPNRSSAVSKTEFRLRNKKTDAFLLREDLLLDDNEESEKLIPPVAIFFNEEEAHEARYMYEQMQERLGLEVEVEVVAISEGKTLYTA